MNLSILAETEGVIAVNKPAGLATTGRSLDDPESLQFAVMEHYRRMIWALHQLDKSTSGLVLFVRRKRMVATWQGFLTSPGTRKMYLAVIHGHLPEDQLVVDAPIRRSHESGFMEIHPGGKPARTGFEVLASSDAFQTLKVRLFTGRTHQIRVHLQHLGLSLVGESTYRPTICTRLPRHALHAAGVLGHSPVDHNMISFTAPLADDIARLCEELSLPPPALEEVAI